MSLPASPTSHPRPDSRGESKGSLMMNQHQIREDVMHLCKRVASFHQNLVMNQHQIRANVVHHCVIANMIAPSTRTFYKCCLTRCHRVCWMKWQCVYNNTFDGCLCEKTKQFPGRLLNWIKSELFARQKKGTLREGKSTSRSNCETNSIPNIPWMSYLIMVPLYW